MSVKFDKRSAVLAAIFPSIALGLLNGLYMEGLYKWKPLWYWIADAFQYVVVPALALWFLSSVAAVKPGDFGFRRFQVELSRIDRVALVLFICAVFWLAYEPVRDVAYRFLSQYAPSFGHGSVIPQSGTARIFVVVYFSATAALVEEAAFRGLPWLYLAQYSPDLHAKRWYVALTSLGFAAIHWEQGPHAVIASFSLGVAAAMLYVRVQNLWPFVGGHFVADLVAFS